MKAESGIKPQLFQVDKVGEMAHISLFDNIREVKREEISVFEYDYYFLEVLHRENLEADVELNYDKWLEMAKEEELIELDKEITQENMFEDYLLDLDMRVLMMEYQL